MGKPTRNPWPDNLRSRDKVRVKGFGPGMIEEVLKPGKLYLVSHQETGDRKTFDRIGILRTFG